MHFFPVNLYIIIFVELEYVDMHALFLHKTEGEKEKKHVHTQVLNDEWRAVLFHI